MSDIRPATAAEIGQLADLACALFTGTMPFAVSRGNVAATMTAVLFGGGYLRVLDVDGTIAGFLCGSLGPVKAWSAEVVALECLFGIVPDARRGGAADRMLADFEAWVRARQIQKAFISAQIGEDAELIDRFYRRLGYRPVETCYMKVLDVA